jgi:hypothetical protein
MPDCNECHEPFDTWESLALHIMAHKNHRKGRIWASKVLVQVNDKQDFKPRLPEVEHTAYGDEQREKYVREISGEMKSGLVKCPACSQMFSAKIEVEYVDNRPWRDDNGKLLIVCGNCRTTRK